MGSVNFNQITLTPLKQISTPGGDVLHALKKNDFCFNGFGEAYFSWVLPNSIKAWKKHTLMTMNLIVPVGLVKFVFYDENKQFHEECIGEDSYSRLTVPPGFWFGFQGISNKPSLILNIANILHNPTEADRLNVSEIHYPWN